MTMKAMDLYLEAMGFKVSRGYDRRRCMYTFTISKDGIGASADFKYPEGYDDTTKDMEQRRFIDHIVSMYASHVRNPFITPGESKPKPEKSWDRSGIKNVIFNPPATIVFWNDGTKTVVQARGDDEFDPEKGLAMAICKKILGNDYGYYNTFEKWTKRYYKEQQKFTDEFANALHSIFENAILSLKDVRLTEDKLFIGEVEPNKTDSDWLE